MQPKRSSIFSKIFGMFKKDKGIQPVSTAGPESPSAATPSGSGPTNTPQPPQTSSTPPQPPVTTPPTTPLV